MSGSHLSFLPSSLVHLLQVLPLGVLASQHPCLTATSCLELRPHVQELVILYMQFVGSGVYGKSMFRILWQPINLRAKPRDPSWPVQQLRAKPRVMWHNPKLPQTIAIGNPDGTCPFVLQLMSRTNSFQTTYAHYL